MARSGFAERRRIRVRGTVQGVGFRPFVYREASRLALGGWVLNDSLGVLIEAEGSASSLDELTRLLHDASPPLSRVVSVSTTRVPPHGDGTFCIRDSARMGAPAAAVSADAATCDACVAELCDPSDRRYRYPFVNCTNCGPRYTIVLGVPYDRPATTMAGFQMCAACRAEYDDPADRRFHAQPNACPTCGPHLHWCTPAGQVVATCDEALRAAGAALTSGRIVAIKGLGGYHLAVDAADDAAVRELRRRKARDDKPFAVMVPSVVTARAVCDLDASATACLRSPARPIVLAPRRPRTAVAEGVAPDLSELGLMLPYTPLHHLLLADTGRPLVMTSGNLSDEPIAHEDSDALERLGPLVDGVLAHDRPIHIRCDDSVMRAARAGVQMVRRSRGYAPEPLPLPAPARRPVLAVGAMLKNTVAVAKDRIVVVSHHIGDLEHLASFQSFVQAVEHLPRLHGVTPEVVAHDLHPEYVSTKWALDSDLEPWPVQHHHAHVASCLVEHGRTDTVLGVAFDGLGYGTDGTLWGGELLVADLRDFSRAGHLLPVCLPGGAAAIREPWRMAVAWLYAAGGEKLVRRVAPVLDERWPAVLQVVASGRNRSTSSVGRLFDAVAAMVTGRRAVTYEGQAATELEVIAGRAASARGYAVPVDRTGPLPMLDARPLVAAVAEDVLAGVDPAAIAAGFHRSLADATADLATAVAGSRGLDTAALSGGVFQNVLLAGQVAARLERAGLRVLTHRLVPPNDGGISVGQAAIAAMSR